MEIDLSRIQLFSLMTNAPHTSKTPASVKTLSFYRHLQENHVTPLINRNKDGDIKHLIDILKDTCNTCMLEVFTSKKICRQYHDMEID